MTSIKNLTIQCDTREHSGQIERIETQFDDIGVKHFRSKLFVGDYQSLDRPRLVVDRKKSLLELCSNVTQGHERFRKELLRAEDAGIKLVILCEEDGIDSLEDVYFWDNPRLVESPRATTGAQLYRSLCTIRDRYGVRIEFCKKSETGKKIITFIPPGLHKFFCPPSA